MNKIILFIIFVIPGFISIKIWSYIVPTERIKLSENILDAISYSSINYAILSWLILIISRDNYYTQHPYVTGASIFCMLFITPIIWPIALNGLVQSESFKGRILNPIPKAWDYFFGLGEPCFVIVHLKEGNLIGGLYGYNSYVTSYPHEEDIYLEEVWKLDETGCFQERIKDTKGLWISKTDYTYLEFLNVLQEEDENAKTD
jgi:hypothetical protein